MEWPPPASGGEPPRRSLESAEPLSDSHGLMPPDEDLIVAIVARDVSGLDVLYQRYGRRMLALAQRIIGDATFAEDVVQDVFLALWLRPEAFDGRRGRVATWLLSVTHHRSVDVIRREESLRRRERRAGAEVLVDVRENVTGTDVHDEVWARVRAADVREALQRLPEVQRDVLVLAYFGGYTQRQVAALTGAPLGTVKTRMLGGLKRLAASLGHHRNSGGTTS